MGSVGGRDGRAFPELGRARRPAAGQAVRHGGRAALNRAQSPRHSSYLLHPTKRKLDESLIRRATVTAQETIYRQNQRLP
ncbi:hypothetical protein DIE15_17185 [Burkholderia sp. Bp9031]|nr:hypothetical protein DIE15_17185 [Burkholderia sp. Bp9031]